MFFCKQDAATGLLFGRLAILVFGSEYVHSKSAGRRVLSDETDLVDPVKKKYAPFFHYHRFIFDNDIRKGVYFLVYGKTGRTGQNRTFDSKKVVLMTVAELKKMSVDERLILMEELWDSLCHDTVSTQSPEWHKEILDDRMNLISVRPKKQF